MDGGRLVRSRQSSLVVLIEIPHYQTKKILFDSVPVPDPDPPDPHVFGPPGSGSFNHQAKIVRKPLIPTVL